MRTVRNAIAIVFMITIFSTPGVLRADSCSEYWAGYDCDCYYD